MTRKKRERRRVASDAFAETWSHQFTDRQYSRYHHQDITSPKAKGIQRQLPANMPRPLRRELAKSIAKLERLAREGKDPPAILVDYVDSEAQVSTFRYISAPASRADCRRAHYGRPAPAGS